MGERPQSTINPQAFALQAGLNSVPKKKAPVVVSSQAPMQSSLQPQPMQSQAPTVATPKPVVTPKIGGITPTFGATNINAQPTLWGATPQELGKQQQIINSQPNLPQELPETGVDKTVPQKVDYIQSIKDLKETLNTSDSLDDIRWVFPEFSKLDDSALADLIATTRDNEDLDDILGVFPELNKSVGEGNILTDNFITDLGSGIAQSVANYGKLGKKLGIKAGNALRPVFGKEKYSKDELASMYDNSDTTVDQITNRQTPEQAKSVGGTIGRVEGELLQGSAMWAPVVKAFSKIPAVANIAKKVPQISKIVKGGLTALEGQAEYNLTSEGRLPTKKEGGIAAGVGMLIPWASAIMKEGKKVLPKISWALKESAGTSVSKALAPTGKKMKQVTERLTPEFLKKGIWGSKTSMLQTAKRGLENFGNKIDEALESGVLDDVEIPKASIDKVLHEARLTTEVGGKVVNTTARRVVNEAQKMINQFPEAIKWTEARALKQVLDGVVYATKGGIWAEDLTYKNVIYNNMANMLRKELANSSPDLAKLNKEYSFYKNLEQVLETTLTRTKPQSGMLKRVGSTIIAGEGNGWVVDRAVKYIASKVFLDATSSATRHTISAQLKNKLANSIFKNPQAVNAVVSQINKSHNLALPYMKDVGVPLKEWATVFPWTKGQIGSSKPIPKSNQTTREIWAIWKPYPNSTVPVKASEEVLSKPKTKVPVKESNPLLAEAKKYKSAEDFVDWISENLAKKNIMTFDEFQKTKPSTTIEMYNKIKKEMPFVLEKEWEFIKWVNQAQLDKMVNPWSNWRHYQLKQIREEANGKPIPKSKK